MSDKKLQFMKGYLIGIRHTDGSLFFDNYHRSWKFQLQAIDKEMVNYTRECFKELFGRSLTLQKCKRKTNANKTVWQVSTYVQKIKDTFDIENIKTKEEKRGFISAFYDAEGSLLFDKRKKNAWRIQFACENERLKLFLSNLLNKLGFVNSNYKHKVGLLNGTEGVKLFLNFFMPKIKRKRFV